MESNRIEKSLRERVRQQILDLIAHMDLSYSTRLLSEQQLATKFQVSRSTIRAVLADLEMEGKIVRRHGSGTYVNPPALDVETTLYPRGSMHDLIRKNGYVPRYNVMSVEKTLARDHGWKLKLRPSDPMTEIHSIYYAGSRPCMYCVDRVSSERFAGFDWKSLSGYEGSIYEYIRQATGVDIVWDVVDFRAALSGELEGLRTCFPLPSGGIIPLVRLEITNFDSKNEPVLLGNIYVDTSQIRLSIVRDVTKL